MGNVIMQGNKFIPSFKIQPMIMASHLSAVILLSGLFLLVDSANSEAADWSPFPVVEWDPPFNNEEKRTERTYTSYSEEVSKKWKICASIPHLKDAYWLAVNYGLVDQARRMQISLSIHSAGGYEHQDIQVRQIQKCIADGADALIVSSISASGLTDALVAVEAKGVPVIDLINGMDFSGLQARAAADFYDNGFETGRYIAAQHESRVSPATVLWFPGPKAAAWAQRADLGFRDALKKSNVKILAAYYGDTGKKVQTDLVNEALAQYPDVDFIAGTAVSAEASVPIIRRKRLSDRTKVVAYYFTPGVQRGLKRGTIMAAPSDLQAILARISIDQAIRILEKKDYLRHVGPKIKMIDQSTLPRFDLTTSLAPRGFKPIFDVN